MSLRAPHGRIEKPVGHFRYKHLAKDNPSLSERIATSALNHASGTTRRAYLTSP